MVRLGKCDPRIQPWIWAVYGLLECWLLMQHRLVCFQQQTLKCLLFTPICHWDVLSTLQTKFRFCILWKSLNNSDTAVSQLISCISVVPNLGYLYPQEYLPELQKALNKGRKRLDCIGMLGGADKAGRKSAS